MPLISGIAALVVFANRTEQGGGDPQIDKQFAIVKQGAPVEPAVASTTVASSAENLGHAKSPDGRAICQDGSGLTLAGTSLAQVPLLSGLFISADPVAQVSGSGQPPTRAGQRVDRTAAFPLMSYFSDNGLSRIKGMDRPVSIQFNNASAADVIKWLSKQSVNFVANLDKLPKSKITMNVSQVPLHEALETVAESLGGSWQVKGSTLIFHSGPPLTRSFFAPTRAGSTNGFEFKTFGDARAFSQMDEKQMKAFEKSSKEMSERMKSYSLNLKDFPKMDPKAFEELKSLQGLGKDGKAFDMKGLSGLRGSLGEIKGFKGMTFKKVDPEKFSKSMTPAQKDLLKKQGHLKFSDLTEAQKAMLFEGLSKDMPKDFTFMLSVNGEKIVIKG